MLSPRTSWRRRPLLALLVLILLLVIGYTARAVRDDHPAPRPSSSTSQPLGLLQLPAQARDTVSLIRRHGPFPYRQDGEVYANLERQLPIQPRGYYHEYTVATPGSPDRGTRRIITGADGRFYYTADHYHSFRQITLTG